MPKRITAEELQELVKAMEDKFRPRNERLSAIFERRWRLHETKIPAEYKQTAFEFHSPFVFDLLRRAPVLLGTEIPSAIVTPAKIGQRAQENSSLREHWINSALRLATGGKPVWSQIRDAVCADGFAVWKMRLQQIRYGGYGKQKPDEDDETYTDRATEWHRHHFPFVWEHVSSETFYPVSYDDDGLCEAMEITEREALPIARQYGLSVNAQGKAQKLGPVSSRPDQQVAKGVKTVKFVEYCNREEFVQLVGGEVIARGKHKLGRPYYFEAKSMATSVKDPRYESLSMAEPLLEIQDFLDSLLTMKSNQMYLTTMPPFLLDPVADDPDRIPPGGFNIAWGPGKFFNVPYGYRPKVFEIPPTGPDLNGLIAFMKELADQVSLAPILYGTPPGADTSGVLANTLLAIAKSLLGDAANSLSLALGETAAFMQYCVEKVLEDKVPVFQKDSSEWLELGPKDVNGYYEVEFELQPIIPAEKQVRYTLLADAEQRGYVDKDEVRTALGYTAPEEMGDRVAIAKLLEDPAIQQVERQELLRRLSAAVPSGPPGMGTPPAPSGGPGGFGQPQLAGVQQPMYPGGPMTAQPAPQAMPAGVPAIGG